MDTGEMDSKRGAFGIKALPGKNMGQLRWYSKVRAKALTKRGDRQKGADLNSHQQGSRILGQYDSQVAYGQRRILLVWTRLIMPDGSWIALDRLQGTDTAGYAGLEDQVDSHWGRIFAGATLTTLLGVNSQLVNNDQAVNSGSVTVAVRQSSQDSLNQVGQQITRKNLNIQPTLVVRPGFPFRIIVNKDLSLSPVVRTTSSRPNS
jgi:type IV secretory pathway VirB10-like protein